MNSVFGLRLTWLGIGLIGLLLGTASAAAENNDGLRAGVVKVLASRGREGSGFVVSREGNEAWIVTASHVVEGDDKPRVVFFQQQNTETTAEIKHQEAGDGRGLAVLKVSSGLPAGLSVLSMAAQDLSIDAETLVIGFPQGGGPWATTRANVSAQDGRDFKLGGTVDNGNSGGPVIIAGQVAGLMYGMSGKFGGAVPVSILKTTLKGWQIPIGQVAAVTVVPSVVVADCAFCPELVYIPAGEFMMGSGDDDELAYADEKPAHKVKVAGFALGKYEVTKGQFAAFVADSRHSFSGGCNVWVEKAWQLNKDKDWRNPGFSQTDLEPVLCVSYEDAMAYIGWLNNTPEVKAKGKLYRLPTEAEWEYAARAGTKTIHYWGDSMDAACLNANVADQTAKQTFSDWTVADCTDAYVYTAPVGQFLRNKFGLFDMLGNVNEWTCSTDTEQYNGNEKNCANGDARRVVRGGSWDFKQLGLRSAFRNRYDPGTRNFNLGFRLAQD